MARLGALKAKLADAENRLGRLYAAMESGVADLTDLTPEGPCRRRENRARHRSDRLRSRAGRK